MAVNAYRRLLKELDEIGSNFPSRVQTDRLNYLAENGDETIPVEIKNLIKELYSSYSYYTDNKFEGRELVVRAIALLELHLELGSEQQVSSNDALLPTFSLPQDDKSRVLELCGQMRQIIIKTDFLDDPHRRRLLDRVAGIEHQVHQPKGIFDIVRGGIDDVGETLGTFGKNVKPLTDRMKEVAQIARRNTQEYDQLPAPEEIKQLPAPSDTED